MINKLICLCLVSFFYSSVLAQDSSALNKFQERTIYQLGNGFYVNDKKVRYKELKTLLNTYPDAAAEYKIYSRRSTVSALMFLGSLVLEGVGFATINSNKDLSNGLIYTALAIQLTAIPISISGKNRFYKSMRLYNKNVMAF